MKSKSLQVILVHMPWGALERPALGLALLEAALQRDDVGCRTAYLNLRLADRLGTDFYNRITHEFPHIAFIGDWLFSQALYGHNAGRDASYVQEILREEWHISEAMIAQLLLAREAIEPFLRDALSAYDWGSFDLVGFTSTFEQNIAALAMAQRLKNRHPAVRIAFGGANWEGVMGQEYHRHFPFVDYVCSGEADVSFPQLVSALGTAPQTLLRRLAKIPGIVYRGPDGKTVATGSAAPVDALDDLPIPSYDTYFAERATSHAAMGTSPVLLFEASRGCWWGAKSHCTFCGLNGNSMHYRAKSPLRLVNELRHLTSRWPCPTIEAVDNILDMAYFDTVLPMLETLDLPGPVFFEVKANLKRHHVAALKRANITRIQPGIESLSDHVLKLMRKGTTALHNVQLLKWCREYDIEVDWNLLYGFPGETDADYDAMVELLPKLSHLQAPGACGPIRLDRFSPYFQDPAAFGLCQVEALPVYRYLYPLAGVQHDKVAYYFRFSYRADCPASSHAYEAVRVAEALRQNAAYGGSLSALPCLDGSLQLYDSRPVASLTTLRLSPVERTILMSIDEVASLHKTMNAIQTAFPGERYDANDVATFLDELASLGIVLKEKNGDTAHYLSLATMPLRLRTELETVSRRRAPTMLRIAAPNGPEVAHV